MTTRRKANRRAGRPGPARAIHRRHEFGPRTRGRLAGEVGYRCSIPDCAAPTIGPSSSSASGLSSSGVAAHITAAAPGGPRYEGALTRSERESHSNGIWCCGRHGRIVDNDTTLYTAEQLRSWKTAAIERQRRSHEMGQIDPGGIGEEIRRIRHGLAERALTACRRACGAIVQGLHLATDQRDRPIGSIGPLDAKRLKRAHDRWKQEIERVNTDLRDVIIALSVHLPFEMRTPGQQPLFSLLLLQAHAKNWEIWLTSAFEDDHHERIGFSGPNPERWLWWKVFDGDIQHEGELRAALAQYQSAVEAWAAPLLVTRST